MRSIPFRFLRRLQIPTFAVVSLGATCLNLLPCLASLQAAGGASAFILTPPAPDTPSVNGPGVFGVRPGSPFLYTIPATGKPPLEYAADGLPSGLRVDGRTGRITGVLNEAGEHRITLRARNALGSSSKPFRIVVGDQIALTPPMGWNGWNSYAETISQEKVLSCARVMVEKGLAAHGWTYVNIDDTWEGVRGGEYQAIQPNSKFPDMAALANDIHALGLKFGVYSSPWVITYAGHIGSSSDNQDGSYDWIKSGDHNEFERFSKDDNNAREKRRPLRKFGRFSFVEKDVAQWAAWGVDYLKYDWHPMDVPHVEDMARALRRSGRDIVYSLSNGASRESAAAYQGSANLWRTTGDIYDNWPKVSEIGFSQDAWATYAGPGHWNDLDMLVVGNVSTGKSIHPTQLTPDEQYTHFSLWCLQSAPLLIGCVLTQLDDFTLGLLTNDEVLAVDQDALGKQAVQVGREGDKVAYVKPMEDGSMAVGLFNLGSTEAVVSIKWGDLGAPENKQMMVRDLWRQKELGTFAGKFEAKVAAHGVVLVRIGAAKP